jgi:hypothetical protein
MADPGVDGRLMRLIAPDQVIAAFGIDKGIRFLLAAADGTLMTLGANDIPLSRGLDGASVKVLPKGKLQGVIPWRSDCPAWIVTNQRVFRLDSGSSPSGKLSLDKRETLVGVMT